MEEEKKDGNYALNTWQDIWKYDKARLLDLGNDFQVWISQDKPEIDEESRAITSFEKLTEDRPRPIKHTLVDAVRVLPDIITLASGPVYAAAKQAVVKGSAKKLGKEVAEKLVKETASEVADTFSKSLLLPKNLKNKAGKKWARDLYENEAAMRRIVGRDLKADELRAIKNALPESIEKKVAKQNSRLAEVDDDRFQIMVALRQMFENTDRKMDPFYEKKLKAFQDLVVDNGLDDAKKLAEYKNFIARESGLSRDRVQRIIDNLDAIPAGYRSNVSSEYTADSILKNIPKQKIDKMTKFKEVSKDTFNPVHTAVAGLGVGRKAAESVLGTAKESVIKGNGIVMKPNYWTLGSEPTPASDFFASMFNVDFDDPARFNKKDIDAFFDFLEDIGTIEPGIKDKWTPRQKVSVLREMMDDKEYGSYIKKRWANSKHKKDWLKSYSGE